MLPPPERLLGDVLRMKPHTRSGQWSAAEFVRDLIEGHHLGTVEILSFDVPHALESGSYPLVKIISEFGVSAKGASSELMTWLGHLDTVDPQPEQKSRDALILESDGSRMKGKGRGSLDMWGGNLAYLSALDLLRTANGARRAVQIILSSREEAGSEVLWEAIKQNKIEESSIGATTEIMVGDNGKPSPLYRGRTGRVGMNVTFQGVAPHAGSVDRHPELIDQTAHRYLGRALDEILDGERGWKILNPHPEDALGLLPKHSRAIPGLPGGKVYGLSVPHELIQPFNVFTCDPRVAPETVVAELRAYLLGKNIPHDCLEVRLEERNGVGFIGPWLTPHDHPLVLAGQSHANTLHDSEVPITAASGVAEEGMLFHELGTYFIGWAPDGAYAHETEEYIWMDSIRQRAEWLKKLIQHDGSLA